MIRRVYGLIGTVVGRRAALAIAGGAGALLSPLLAHAADLGSQAAVKAPPALIVQSGGVYAWLDGSYQSVDLPSVGNFGFRALPLVGEPVPSETHGTRLDGYGVSGGFGYVFRDGTFSPLWGSRVRLELDASYVKADGVSYADSARTTNTNVTAANLQGVRPGIAGCGGDTCWTQSRLTTEHSSWSISLRGKSDYRSGPVVWSPSLAIFAGRSNTDHALGQQLYTLALGLYPGVNNYVLNAALDWNDWGAKFGLDATYDLNSWLALRLGGKVGVAHRSASLTASDSFLFSGARSSSLTEDRSITAFTGNLEGGALVQLGRNISVRGFGGLNYDNKTPGIAAPTVIASSLSGSPAQIKFESTTSYYAGGGMIVKFAP